jgi:hypothetical protein
MVRRATAIGPATTPQLICKTYVRAIIHFWDCCGANEVPKFDRRPIEGQADAIGCKLEINAPRPEGVGGGRRPCVAPPMEDRPKTMEPSPLEPLELHEADPVAIRP